jgi:hypothetical protein
MVKRFYVSSPAARINAGVKGRCARPVRKSSQDRACVLAGGGVLLCCDRARKTGMACAVRPKKWAIEALPCRIREGCVDGYQLAYLAWRLLYEGIELFRWWG